MAGFIERLQTEWPVIEQAPFSFTLMAIAVGGLTWAVVSLLNRGKAETLESRLGLRDDEIADLKRKLSEAESLVTARSVAASQERHRQRGKIAQLTGEYLGEHDGNSSAMMAGRELPVDWINAKLAEDGEAWRVISVQGQYQIAEFVGSALRP